MAAVSALAQVRRKKQATYGKTSRNVGAWNMSLDELDDLDTPAAKSTATVAAKSVKEVYPVQKKETRPDAPKPSKPRTKKLDTWDVPSSDDEDASPVRHKSPPKALARRKVISKIQETEPELAPWEKSKVEPKQSVKGYTQRPKKQYGTATADNQLMSDLARSLQEENVAPAALGQPRLQPSVELKPMAPMASPKSSSAAEKLRARRSLAGGAPHAVVNLVSTTPNQKRHGEEPAISSSSPRKRLKTGSPEDFQDADVDMGDAPPVRCESQARSTPLSTNEMDVYDFPESSADEIAMSKPTVSPRKPVQKRARRGKITTYSSPRKMESAPARLSEMLPPDTDTTDSTTRSPSMITSRPTTPHKSSSASKAATPETAIRRSAAMTPKQAQLWDRLLTSDTAHSSPSALPMQDLTLNSRRPTKADNAPSRQLARSATDVGARRPKLVDRLKATALSSDDETSGQDESDQSSEDVDMDASDAVQEPTSSQQSQSQSQSQSQNSMGGRSGPKTTYAETRSYLPDDNFEDQLPFDLPATSPPKPTAASRRDVAKGPGASQKSTFDFEDSEGEDDTRRIRTIHELRAGGGNQRFLDSLGGLLEDIADHNITARSRRRSALMELAAKLVEPGFLEKFFRHGYERQLLAECSAAPDAIADFTLATIFVTITAGDDPPDHIVQSLKQGDVLSWLTRLVTNTTDPKKLARDRSNNMSKSAQASFVQFVNSFAEQEKVWKDYTPTTITPRILALKAYDQLIRRLRISGDRSELVDANILRQIVPTEDDVRGSQSVDLDDVAASASALESLSMLALSLAWPADIIERVTDLLMSLRAGVGKTQQHLHFVTLRLCIYLTLENARNCRVFARQATILYLLQTISDGLVKLAADDEPDEEQRTVQRELLIFSVTVMTNLAEHNKNAIGFTVTSEAQPLLSSIADMFQQGQQRLTEAKSLDGTLNNVAYGWLAVMLAGLLRNPRAKSVIASRLPGGKLNALVDAVAEFIKHHESLVNLALEDEDHEAAAGWDASAEKLRGVMSRLKTEAEG